MFLFCHENLPTHFFVFVACFHIICFLIFLFDHWPLVSCLFLDKKADSISNFLTSENRMPTALEKRWISTVSILKWKREFTNLINSFYYSFHAKQNEQIFSLSFANYDLCSCSKSNWLVCCFCIKNSAQMCQLPVLMFAFFFDCRQ